MVWLILTVTQSAMDDIGGLVDWGLIFAVWLGRALGTTAAAYAILRPMRM